MTNEPDQRRRKSDREPEDFGTRLTVLEGDVKRVLVSQDDASRKLDGIRDVMSDPQASPLGRMVLRLEAEVDSLNAFRSEARGVEKFTKLVQVILGIAVALITIALAVNRT